MVDFLSLARRVRRGVRALDRKVPNWRSIMRRHKSEFDFANANCCILGTIGNHFAKAKALAKEAELDAFHAALKLLTGSYFGSGAYGFDVVDDESSAEIYPALSALWQAEFEQGQRQQRA